MKRKHDTAEMTKVYACMYLLLTVFAVFIITAHARPAHAGLYLNSAHGDSSDGVKRGSTGFPSDYPRGLCAHCHELHASIGGSEPNPTGGPDDYSLFYTSHTSQTDNFCFECHKGVGSEQTGGSIVNRSYSYRAGNWSSDTVDDILESFSFSSPGTSHNLDDISTFIVTKGWGYTSDSNPCIACHNPHAAQGDPLGAGSSAKSSGTRGWPVSRPSMHSTDNNSWALWGDGSGEKMSDYTTGYQAPYRYNSTTAHEPDGSTTEDGSNLTDFVTFCTDCHNNTNTIYSTTLGRNLYTFNWNNEKHGGGAAANDGDATFPITDVVDPYLEGQLGSYVLACTDCHEPHGSSNRFLIRKGVNGGSSTVSVTETGTPDNSKDWKSLCTKCHDDSSNNMKNIHHSVWDRLWAGDFDQCYYCHEPEANDFRNCLLCHYHGNNSLPAVSEYDLPEYSYGEQLF